MADYELLTLERRDDGVAVVTLANGKVNALSRQLLAEIRVAGGAARRPARRGRGHRRRPNLRCRGRHLASSADRRRRRVIAEAFHSRRSMRVAATAPLRHRCGQRLRARRRLRAGARLRLPHRLREGACSVNRRSCSASSRAAAAHSGCPVRSVPAVPRRCASPAVRCGPTKRCVSGSPTRSCAPTSSTDRALALAAEVASGALVAQAITKRVIDAGLSTSLDDGLALERAAFVEVFGTDDCADRRRELPRARTGQGRVLRPLIERSVAIDRLGRSERGVTPGRRVRRPVCAAP